MTKEAFIRFYHYDRIEKTPRELRVMAKRYAESSDKSLDSLKKLSLESDEKLREAYNQLTFKKDKFDIPDVLHQLQQVLSQDDVIDVYTDEVFSPWRVVYETVIDSKDTYLTECKDAYLFHMLNLILFFASERHEDIVSVPPIHPKMPKISLN